MLLPVQYSINITYHTSIRMSPYRAVFTQDPRTKANVVDLLVTHEGGPTAGDVSGVTGTGGGRASAAMPASSSGDLGGIISQGVLKREDQVQVRKT
jgi:hypothetical protein